MITIQETTTLAELETELAKIGAQIRVYQVEGPRPLTAFGPIDPSHRWGAMLTSVNGIGRATFATGIELYDAVKNVFSEHRASIKRAFDQRGATS